MEYLQLLTQLIDIVIWPLFILIIILVFKDSIIKLLNLVQKLKVKDIVEVDFAKDITKLKDKADKKLSKNSFGYDLINLAISKPNEAILRSWDEITIFTESIAKSIDPDINLDIPARYKLIEKTLLKCPDLDKEKIKILNDLRQLRNKVKHASGYKINEIQAIEYVNLSLRLIDDLKNIAS